MIKYIIMSFVLVLTISCGDKTDTRPAQEQIDEYLTKEGMTALKTSSGLNYIILDEGMGTARPDISSTVTVNYTGRLLNGDEFDAGSNVSFPLSRVILGWQEGIPLFKKGGKGILLIPPDLGYGSSGTGSIPPNAVLVFEIELLDF